MWIEFTVLEVCNPYYYASNRSIFMLLFNALIRATMLAMAQIMLLIRAKDPRTGVGLVVAPHHLLIWSIFIRIIVAYQQYHNLIMLKINLLFLFCLISLLSAYYRGKSHFSSNSYACINPICCIKTLCYPFVLVVAIVLLDVSFLTPMHILYVWFPKLRFD